MLLFFVCHGYQCQDAQSFQSLHLLAQEGMNPKTGEISKSLRSAIEEVPGVNVLRLAAEGKLFPSDDEEPT